MILLIPLGPGDAEPRAPRLTLVLVAVNVLMFLLTLRFDTQQTTDAEAELARVAEWSLRVAARDAPALAARLAGADSPLQFLESDAAWRSETKSEDLRERLEQVLADYQQLKARHPFYDHGVVPAQLRARQLLTHQFLHVDALHLLFNMLFLWTVGGLLELSLGAALFASAYLAGGIAAALTHVAFNPASAEPAIGASGAVSAAMGIAAVLHWRRPIRLLLIAMLGAAPRHWMLVWPAWVFLSLWLVEQLFFASFGSKALGVAFAAHLGGFAFGVLAGMALGRLRGAELA